MERFQDLERFTDRDVEAAISRNDPEEPQLVPIIVALMSPDCSAAQKVCLKLSSHEHYKVRAHALISLGHLARRFRVLDENTVIPVIEQALGDKYDYIRTHARSAADEIHQFLHWQIAGPRVRVIMLPQFESFKGFKQFQQLKRLKLFKQFKRFKLLEVF